jgi:hypothetical protein
MRTNQTYLALFALCAALPGIAVCQLPQPVAANANPAQADVSFKDSLDQLDSEIAAELAGKPSGGDNRRIITLAAQIQRDFARGNYEGIRGSLADLLDAVPAPQGKQIVIQLQQALPGAIAAGRDAVAAQVAALRDRAATLCMTSRRESDFDTLLNEIDALQMGLATQLDAREQEKLGAAREFLVQWQKYVAQDAASYHVAALATLRAIRDSPSSFPLVPLSSVDSQIDQLARFETSARIEKILGGVKTLDDLPGAITALRAIPVSDSQNSTLPSTLDELTRMESGAAALKAGDYAAALAAVTVPPFPADEYIKEGRQMFSTLDSGSFGGVGSEVFFSLRTQLLAALLPVYLALPENPRPKAGEGPSQFLLRLAGDAAARGDYGEVPQILSAYKLCAFDGNPPAWVDSGIAACAAYFQGQKLEQAGSFSAAIGAYHRVLQQLPGNFSPASQASARILALSKEHPADFIKATSALLNPAPSPPVGGG